MIFKRLIPQTLVGQLMALLFSVLLIGQIVNLSLLVGTQRLQARDNAYAEAMDHAAFLLTQVPEDLYVDLPYLLPQGRGALPGSYFLSADNEASLTSPDVQVDLPRYNTKFAYLLEARGFKVLQTSMSLFPDGPPAIEDFNIADIIEGRGLGPLGLPPPDRPDFRRRPGFDRPPPPPRDGRRGRSENLSHYPPPFTPSSTLLGAPETAVQEIRLSAELAPGIWFNALIPQAATESLTGRILLATALLLGLSLLAVWFFARRLSRPISNFARAAEQLGRGEGPDVLEEAGARDVKLAAQAFNNMQTRVTRMLDTQRTMLRAVGHDLRTPLTSLRIRAENIEDDVERGKVIATLNDMTVMTEEILSWAKDASGTEDLALVDLHALLESMTDNYQDQGHHVELRDFESMVVKIRRISIKRAIQNLIDNALKFGHTATLSVERKGKLVLIHVDDVGLGVPREQQEEILKPFVRLEASRNKETGGTGLGLSIANSIAQIHGGTLAMSNREPKGLRVTLTLPI